jgi:hypothetical protein
VDEEAFLRVMGFELKFLYFEEMFEVRNGIIGHV